MTSLATQPNSAGGTATFNGKASRHIPHIDDKLGKRLKLPAGVMDKSVKRVVIAAFVIQAVIGYLLLHYRLVD